MASTNGDQLLTALNVNRMDHVILIKEHDAADSNFILTHLMKQFLSEKNSQICLLIMHNTIGHYVNVGKKLGYDLMARIKQGDVVSIEPMTDIYNELALGSDPVYLERNRKEIIKKLLTQICACFEELRGRNKDNGQMYLIIDDLSHLNDLGIKFSSIMMFVNMFVHGYCSKVNVVINMHIADESDSKISNALEYFTDISVDVAPLKTGRSDDVTGVITITDIALDNICTYHYKTLDKDIRMFRPGESINYFAR